MGIRLAQRRPLLATASVIRCAGPRAGAVTVAIGVIVGLGQGSAAAVPFPAGGHPAAHVAGQDQNAVRSAVPPLRGNLPWPVVLRTDRGAYVETRSGAIRRLGPASRNRIRYPEGFVWLDQQWRTWATVRRGHLVILRKQEVVWRSARRYPVRSAAQLADIVIGVPGVAFQIRNLGHWFVAGWRGPEREVTSRGWPEMWTRSGNLIVVLQGRRSRSSTFAVFSATGTRLATLATGLGVTALDQSGGGAGIFWFMTAGGAVYRTDGWVVTFVASSRALGFSRMPALNVLADGMVQLLSIRPGWSEGQAIFYPDGQPFARIPGPKGQAAGFGELSARPDDGAVAYVVSSLTGTSSTVYVVRPGRAPVAVYRTPRGSSPCGLPLAWHGSWLLYTPNSRPVLIDTAGSYRIIRLPAALRFDTGSTAPVTAAHWR